MAKGSGLVLLLHPIGIYLLSMSRYTCKLVPKVIAS